FAEKLRQPPPSLPSRERGSKPLPHHQEFQSFQRRSLRGSADRNNCNSLACSIQRGRSLRGSADRNNDTSPHTPIVQGRSLRGSADRNLDAPSRLFDNLVAPFAGARIETPNST